MDAFSVPIGGEPAPRGDFPFPYEISTQVSHETAGIFSVFVRVYKICPPVANKVVFLQRIRYNSSVRVFLFDGQESLSRMLQKGC